jgi:transposase
MAKKYIVTLTSEERNSLLSLISLGTGSTRKLTHARILLKADQGAEGPGWTDEQISEALEVSLSTIERVRERFVLAGLAAALSRHPSRNPRTCKVDGEQEAHLVALSCGPAPAGHKRWTLRLLADKMVKLEYIDTISHETVRQVLKKRPQTLVEGTMVHST